MQNYYLDQFFKRLPVSVAVLQALSCWSLAHALPEGELVQAGQVQFQRNGNALNIDQSSARAIVNWQSFSISANEAVNLLQPQSGIALFRVVGSDPSSIYGSLKATGSLFLTNPNGVLFGHGAQVDVGSLVATSMRISNENFLAGRYQFNADNTNGVSNHGVIRTADGGYIVLLGTQVENSGTLTANAGSVVLGSAQSALLDFYGDGLIKTTLSGEALNAVIKNSGQISANGGAVQLATNARSAAINVDGVVQANTLVNRNGVIRLEGGQNARVSVNGNLSTAGNSAGSKGGTIEVTGEQIALLKNANLDASGDAGGGTVLVGGDLQGKNAQVYNARTTFVAQGATIDVSAKQNGNGGKAIVWADSATRYYGSIFAKGGADRGNGGFAEVSGKQYLNFSGKADLSAMNGLAGNLLLDPLNITLTTVDANTTGFTPPGDITQAFTDDASLNSTFNVNVGGSFAGIAAGSTITLQARNDITVSSAFNVATATGSANNSLVLQADNNIVVNAAVSTTGTGSITMQANTDSIGGGNLAIGGNITSQAGGISLSAATITRTAGNIASTGAANADAGNISISSSGTTNLGAATIRANGGTASAGNSGRNGGNVTINVGGYTGTGLINTDGSNGNGANTNGGNAGSVSLTSSNGISATAATAINTTGGNAGATGNGNSGNASTINIINNGVGNITTGALVSRVGVAIGTGTGGTAASINVTNNAGGTLSTGAITTSGNNNSNGNGGNIQLSTTAGNISTGAISSSGGTVRTGNAGKNAGTITINSGGSYTGSTIAASGSNALGTSFSGGNAANITINANTGGITATTITATGGNATATNGNGGAAGTVALSNSTSGNISATTITARNGNAAGTGLGGAVGAINIINNAATGTISTSNLLTQGGTLGQGGNIAINGQNNVTVGTVDTFGGTTLTGNAGRNAGAVTINAGGNLVAAVISNNGSAGLGTNQNGGNGGAVSLTAGAGNTITHNNISTAGGARTGTGVGGNGANINVNGNSLLSVNTIITATPGTGGVTSGTVNFGGTINSSGAGRTLAINTTAATTLNGAIGNTLALTSLTTNTGGTTAINGGSVTTTGVQTYGDAVTTSGATTFATTNSNVTFSSSIVASGNTVISAGTGAVTAANSGNNFSNLAMTAGSANVRDSGAIVLGATNITGNYTLQSGASITQSAPITVGGVTTLNSGTTSDITLANIANNFNSVSITNGRDVNIRDSNALTINTSNVRTIDARALNGNMTLGGNITASGGTPTTSISLSASQNFTNAGNFNLTPGAGKRWLVFSTNETADTRGALLTTTYDFKQYNTLVDGTILGTGDGFINSLVAPNIIAGLGGTSSKIYNGDTSAPIGSLTLTSSGAINSDTVVLGGLSSASFDTKNVGTTKLVTSNNGINIASATNANGKQVFGYQLANTTVSANVGEITPASISAVTGITANNKVYDTTTNATLNTGAAGFTGLLGSDVLNVATATGNFVDKNVANAKTVNVSGISLGGADAGNYTLAATTATTTADITPASISAVTGISANNKVYDTTTNATLNTGAAGFTGLLGSDVLNVATATGNFVDKNVANAKTVNVSGISLGGADAGNYTLAATTATTTADITPASISAVTGISANNKVYDTTTNATLNTGAAGFTGLLGSDVLNVATATGNFVDKNVANAKTVNVSGISLGGADAGNYTLAATTATTTADITPASISAVTGISANNKVYDTTTNATLNTGAAGFTGLLGSDVLNVATATGNFVDKNVANAKTVNVSGISLGGADAGNYTLAATTATTTADITPASISAVTGISANNKVYDTTTNATLNTGAAGFTGLLGSDVLNVATATGNFVDKNVANAKTVNVSGISLGGADAGNYTLAATTATTTADITPASISAVTGISANNKVYDTTTNATLNTGAAGFTGLLGSDVLNVATATGNFVDKNVANAKTVNVSGISLGGADAGNYTLAATTATTTADITPASISAVTGISANNKVYDTTTNATLNTGAAGFTGLLGSDVLNVATATGNFVDKNVANAKTVNVSGISLGGADAGNYTLAATTATTTADITPASISAVTGISANNKVYDTTTNATLNTGAAGFTGLLGSDVLNVATATGNFVDKNVANAKTVNVSGISLGGADAGNYTLAATTATTTADITPASISAVTGISANNKVYDTTTNATLNTGAAGFTGLLGSDVLNVATATGNFVDKNVANAKTVNVSGISLGGADAGNYTLAATTATTTADITPASISAVTGISANNKVYDTTTNATLNTGAAGFTGLLGSDVLNVATATGNFVDKNVANAKTVNVSGISLGGADAGNYTLAATTATTTADITPASISAVTGISANNKVYDTTTNATLNTGAAGFTGLLGSDVLNVATATGNFVDKNVANAKTVNVSGISLGGADAGNYTLAATTATTTADITPASISAVTGISANNKVYDTTTNATLNTGAAGFTGLLGSDVLNVATATGNFVDKNVANAKTVNVSGISLGGADAGNYTLAATTATTTADITPASISAVTGISANNKVYDTTTNATLNTGAAGFTGLLGSDVLNVATATGNFVDKNVANAKTVNVSGISLGGADAGNYTLAATTATTTADITGRNLTISADSGQTKLFGNPDPIFTFTLAGQGLAGSDILSGALSRAPGETVGAYAINLGSLDAGLNYNLSFISNPFSILQPSASSTNITTPRDSAGLVGDIQGVNPYIAYPVYLLSLNPTAAGSGSNELSAANNCAAAPSNVTDNKNALLVLNFGLNLPAGVNNQCFF